MKTEKVYIEIILDSIRKLEMYTKGVTHDMFCENQEKQSATILQLIVIGENANKISEKTQSQIDLPWRDIIGLRNMAVHEYMNLELDIVWNTVTTNIPDLKAKLTQYNESHA